MKIRAKYTVETAKRGKSVGAFRCTFTEHRKRAAAIGNFTVRLMGNCLNTPRDRAAGETS